MYDRRIDEEEHVFGNQGALYKNAMTLYDHRTESVWSQVTGSALSGPMRGTRLRQIPAAVETWSAWRKAHPDTIVLETPGGFGAEPIDPDFVIGIRIGGDSAGFGFEHVLRQAVINERVGGIPVAVFARPDHLIRVYSRNLGGTEVELVAQEGRLVDRRTGTAWDPVSGQGLSGPLSDRPLPSVAWASSFDWAWKDFHPDARIVT